MNEAKPVKPWRERIAEARERGRFTGDDWHDAWDPERCAAGCLRGSVIEAGVDGVTYRRALYADPPDTNGLAQRFPSAVGRHNFDEAERVLDAIEDRVLQLKREASA